MRDQLPPPPTPRSDIAIIYARKLLSDDRRFRSPSPLSHSHTIYKNHEPRNLTANHKLTCCFLVPCYNTCMEKPQNDPILKRFRAAVAEIYGDRVERVVLFGSRARGDARPDSDYDVVVFLRGMPDRTKEMARIAEVETEILYDTGAVVSALPLPSEAYRERTGFMSELRRDGLDL